MKLVRESLLEISQGKLGGLSALGVGIIVPIKKWLESVEIRDYTIKPDMTIDVHRSVKFYSELYHNVEFNQAFPEYIQFGTVYGNFDISDNNFLHLKGCPIKVTKSFNCSNNALSTLELCPKFVGREFVCYQNDVNFTIEDVKKKCQVGTQIFVREYDYHQNSVDYNKMLNAAMENEYE
jgi:hypothetical protein